MNKEKNFYVFNSLKWLFNCGVSNAYNSKLWYLTKTPFSNDFFKQVISDLSNLYKKIIRKKIITQFLFNFYLYFFSGFNRMVYG